MTYRGSPSSRFDSFGILVAVVAATLAGCAGRGHAPQQPVPSTAQAGAHRSGLHPGDALLLKVYRQPDLSDTLRVDENGHVTFPLLGRRDVTGVATDSLRRRVVADYGEYVKGGVDVTVLRRISILGAVKQPGLYPVDPTYSLADALARAGGTTPNADKNDIRLLRDGRVLRQSLEQTRAIASLPVRSGDQIVVGERSWLARNWQWLAGTMVSASVLLLTR